MCATKEVIPTPKVANACTSLACYVAWSGTLLHVHNGAWLHEVQRDWVCKEKAMQITGIIIFHTEKKTNYWLLIVVWLLMFCLEEKTEQKLMECLQCAGWLCDNMGHRRPSTSSSRVQLLQEIKTGNSWEKTTTERNSLHPGYNTHEGSKRNISDVGRVECIIQNWFQTQRWLWTISNSRLFLF